MTPPDQIPLDAADFFVLRTPLLPFGELLRWANGLEAPATASDASDKELAAAVARDRGKLRERLRALLARPEIREALLVASPSLIEGLEAWRRDPESKKGRRTEEALVRYIERMSTRSTPFGLFSGCTTGTIGEATSLRIADRASYRRHTRLDAGYLDEVCEALGRSPELRRRLTYRVSSSLYRIGGRYRYAESRLGKRARTHHLVAVDSDPYLEHALHVARPGVRADALAEALVDLDPDAGVTLAEAREFVDDLIDGQILVPDLFPALTGDAPVDDLIRTLEAVRVPGSAVRVLSDVRTRLEQLDSQPIGTDLGAYGNVAPMLEPLGVPVDPAALLQVDMMKPGAARLGAPVIAEIGRAVHLVHRLPTPEGPGGDLERFRRAFLDRYEPHEEVPLVDVLDEELGIGFARMDGLYGDPAPLIDDLALPLPGPAVGGQGLPDNRLTALLLGKLERALREGSTEIEITEDDLDGWPQNPGPLPGSFLAKVRLATRSEEALAAGDFQILLDFTVGPSAARMLGRFCYADRELEEGVRRHLRREESLDQEAVFAEVVHVPQGRVGNIASRPLLRDYEIPFLGKSGADEAHQIPVTDLTVSVVGERIVLRSRRLGRRVVPRMSNAHNFTTRSLGMYRFLCMAQSDGVCSTIAWDWGALGALSFLPRVRTGRVVVSRARWRVTRAEIKSLDTPNAARQFATARRFRAARRLPRFVLLADGDNKLLVDFDNTLSVAAFVATVKNRRSCTLTELFPGPGDLCVSGPEGGFLHELLVPFTLAAAPRPPLASPPPQAPVRRSFAPGSEWLFAKLYTGTATADRILTAVVGPLAREAIASDTIDRWFFLRFGDPQPHLRLRFHGDPAALHREVLPALEQAVAPLLAGGLAWRFQLQEYRRELERYGGAAGIELAERFFHLDSEAVIDLLRSLPEGQGPDARWRLALLGTDLLLSDLGFDPVTRLELFEEMKASWEKEFRLSDSTVFKKRLANRLRDEMDPLRSVLFEPVPAGHPLAPGLAALRRRSERLRPVVAALRDRERAGELTARIRNLSFSYVHMFNNRLFRSRGREHEMVLADFLSRLHRSEAARERARRRAVRKAG